jgi:hypothetical protein
MLAPDQPTPAKPAKERAPLWIDPGFQARAFLPLLAFAGVLAVLIYFLAIGPLQHSIATETDLGIRAILSAQLDELRWRLLPLFGVALLLAAYIAFYQALHVVRPVYRLHDILRALAAGEQPSLRMEKGEAFRFFEDDVSQLNTKMKLIANRNRDILFGVNAHVMRLASRLANDEVIPRADLEEFVAAIRGHLERAPEIALASRH